MVKGRGRTYYSDYIAHCMRFYARYPSPRFKTEADRQNYLACESVLRRLAPEEREILTELFSAGDTVHERVNEIARRRGIDRDRVWVLLTAAEEKIAKRRGLL